MFRYATVGMVCLLAGAARAQSPTPSAAAIVAAKPVIAMEQPLPGDFWTYEVRDDISGKIGAARSYVVTEVTATEISIRSSVVGKDGSEGFSIFDKSWNLKSLPSWKYEPHDGLGIHSPLVVGTSWSFEGHDIFTEKGNTWKRFGRSKVVGQESITTKAGTFDTFKIETSVSRQMTNDPTRKTELTVQTWYAPVIDHYVKRVFVSRVNNHLMVNNAIELVDYGRKK
jgi:hypothetical protein